ncbi:MAG: integration host factor subunit beta [Candidatus Latescibacteria bacterium]|jgi:DNA-binding protein HU-beta|nr:integration host factor subunit beta [Candidatus Latescibacterota bacterium]
MTKADVIARIASQTGLTKTDVREVVEGFFDAVKSSFKENDPLEIRGFGTFHVVSRAPRKARNPRTGEEVPIPARKRPVFKPSREMIKAISGTD